MKFRKLVTVSTVLIFSISVNYANAASVINYDGTVDPLTLNNWIRSSGATDSIGAGTEQINGINYDYWQVDDHSSSAAGLYAYDFAPNTIDFSNDWYVEASVRVIDTQNAPNTNVPSQAVIVADGLNYWSFYTGNDFLGPVASNTSLAMSQPLPSDYWNDYHTFGIQFSQNSVGTSDDTADFYIDGVLIWDDVSRSILHSSTSSYVGFGGTSTPAATSIANYNYITFDDGAPSVVPVPAAVWLFGSGLIGLAGFARRNKA